MQGAAEVAYGHGARYLELFPDQHWSMSSYDPKERKKLATHAEGVSRLGSQDVLAAARVRLS